MFPTLKGAFKPNKQRKKSHGSEQDLKDSKGSGSNANKDKKPYLGKEKLSIEEIERYKKENRCYKCGETKVIFLALVLSTRYLHKQRRYTTPSKKQKKHLVYALLGER